MQYPVPSDTIVAVATGWHPAALGIVRLSGPDAVRLGRALLAPGGGPRGSHAHWTAERIVFAAGEVPAAVYWFTAPRSYTGQDVVELHTVGALPLLREIADGLIRAGARRALPGEFTARAYLAGRLDANEVAGVLELLQTGQATLTRAAQRDARRTHTERLAAAVEQLTALLARIEAGIDFVEEEDVRFITGPETVAELDALAALLAPLAAPVLALPARPRVALVGLPNAGKSTLFNALLGRQRAIVSPVLGTTRDVLSAELELDGTPIVLQDCAGLGSAAGDLDLATHVATERAAELADLVLWVHAADYPWELHERAAAQRVPAERRVLVLTKTDLLADAPTHAAMTAAPEFGASVSVSCAAGLGLAELRAAVRRALHARPQHAIDSATGKSIPAALEAVARARGVAAASGADLRDEELIALELRSALEALSADEPLVLDEKLLGRVFSEFCVGK